MRTDSSTIDVQGDLGGHKIAMSFDANSLAHIMSVLTDLYSDPELAIIREYSTNAKDSHIAAGVKRPIEITPPTGLNPQFKIQDFGLGLSKQDIIEIYSKYGASTKRGTNEQVGMLGLGCKSALTYSNQFTLIGVKNGIETSVVISRTADGSGTMEVVAEKPTDAHNGVTVIIPARGTPRFQTKIDEFFSYWKQDEVLIAGQPPKERKLIKITDKLFLELNGNENDLIVMGGVAYPIDDQLGKNIYRSYYRRARFIYFADIGEINFTPSREKLHYTTKTKNTIQSIEDLIKNNLNHALTVYLSDSKNHLEFVLRYRRLNDLIKSTGALKYKGEEMPENLPGGQSFDAHASKYKFNKQKTFYPTAVTIWNEKPSAIFVYGLDPDHELTTSEKGKIRRFFEQPEYDHIRFALFLSAPAKAGWFDHVQTLTWSQIKEMKLKREKSATKSPRKYHVISQYGQFCQQTEFNKKKKLVFYSGSRYNEEERRHLWYNFQDCEIVSISINQENKFKADFPHAVEIQELVEKEKAEFKKNLTDTDRIILMLSSRSADLKIYRLLDVSKIEDPEIVEIAKHKDKLENRKIVETSSGFINRWNSAKLYEQERDLYSGVKNPLNKYPLLKAYGGHEVSLEHLYTYINAIYNQFYKRGK